MRKLFLIQVAIAALAQYVFAASSAHQQSHTFHVLHTPNYYGHTLANYYMMGIRFEGNPTIHPLVSSAVDGGIIHTGTFPRDDSTPCYRYVVLYDNQVTASESSYRCLESITTTHYDIFNHTTATTPMARQQEIPLVLPQIQFSSQANDYRYPLLQNDDRNLIHPSNTIPTLHIQAPDMSVLTDRVLEDVTILANLTRIVNDQYQQFNQVKLELSGQTSRLFRKLSYNIQLDKKNNLYGYRRFKLRSCATDPSYLREKVYYDVLRAAGLPSARASYVRLFLNGEPHGLYLMTDNYKNPFLPNILGHKGGALIQGSMQENPLAKSKLQSGASLEYWGSRVEDYFVGKESVYKMQEGKSKDFEKLIEFIKFVHDAEDSKLDDKLEKEWEKRMDVSLFLKHLALEVLLGHGDGYMGSAHNYMMYQDPAQGGRLVWLSSDLDQTIGNTLKATRTCHSPFECLDRYGVFDQTVKRPLVHQLLKVPSFQQQFQRIFGDFHHALFKSNALTQHIISLQNLIEQEVQWDQKLDEYRKDYFASNRSIYDFQVQQKVLQLPLGQDFMDRILSNSIGFKQAIEGPIDQHPSIMPLFSWLTETTEYLSDYVSDFK